MFTTEIDTWDKVEDKLNQLTHKLPLGWGYMSRAVMGEYPCDAFSLGQLMSKAWLINEYKTHTVHRIRSEPRSVALLGCWLGTLAEPLFRADCMIERIWGFDSDQKSVNQSNEFNRKLVNMRWRYKAVCEDVNDIDWNSPQYMVEGQLIEQRPSVVINTSAEHMAPDWYHSVAKDQLVILQTNDNDTIPGHINTVGTEQQLYAMYPMSNPLYVGAIVMPDYTRFMMIGYK
jgi:hypothetical protein